MSIEINTSKENYWKNRQGIKNRYSSYQFQNVHFLYMDTLAKKYWDDGSTQYGFVQKDLRDASADPATDWIIVVTNRVFYASATTTEPRYILKELRELYHPIFRDAGVHIVLQGDIKNYQRSYPLAFNSSDSDQPTLVNDTEEPNYVISEGYSSIQDTSDNIGTIFINDGTGGITHHNIVGPSYFTVSNNAADSGYIHFTLHNTETERKITGVFYRMERIEEPEDNRGNRVVVRYSPDKIDDRFSITKTISRAGS